MPINKQSKDIWSAFFLKTCQAFHQFVDRWFIKCEHFQSELVLLLIQRKGKIWIGEIQIDNIKCSQWAKIILRSWA